MAAQEQVNFGKWENDILYRREMPSSGMLELIPDHEGTTVSEVFQTAVKKYGDSNCVGTRARLSTDYEKDAKTGVAYEKFTMASKYEWMSYKEFSDRARHFGSGLKKWSGVEAKSRMMIYADTQRDWITAMLGGFDHNFTTVTCYATLGAEGAKFAINQVKSPIVVADGKLLKILLEIQPDCPCIKNIVTISEMDSKSKESLEGKGVKVASMQELIDMGKAEEVPKTAPSKEDVAIIMFTSGTTGNPKGVVLMHKNIVASAAGTNQTLSQIGLGHGDVIAGYLPLAHIMEIIVEISCFCAGICVGYSSPHTLTDSGVKLKAGQVGDLKVLRPTVLVFAPLVLEKLYNVITTRVSGLKGLKKKLFNSGLKHGERRHKKGKVGSKPFYQKIVFKKIQKMVGGKLKLALTGSAPLDGAVHRFIQTVLNIPVRQGYGCTETCAASVIQHTENFHTGVVGAPSASACIKLVDWEEGGYKVTDDTNPSIGMKRGEICIGGPAVSSGGYLVDEENPDASIVEKNKVEFRTENGIRWFYTGDIGAINSSGVIKIIDRKKDLVKLQQGEYVALAKVEGIIKLAPLVENCLVHADPTQKYCTVLVVPMEPAMMAWAKQKGIQGTSEEISNSKELADELSAQVKQVCKEKALAKFEIPQKMFVVPLSKAFTPENGLLTAVMKLKRKVIHKAFESEISAMY